MQLVGTYDCARLVLQGGLFWSRRNVTGWQAESMYLHDYAMFKREKRRLVELRGVAMGVRVGDRVTLAPLFSACLRLLRYQLNVVHTESFCYNLEPAKKTVSISGSFLLFIAGCGSLTAPGQPQIAMQHQPRPSLTSSTFYSQSRAAQLMSNIKSVCFVTT